MRVLYMVLAVAAAAVSATQVVKPMKFLQADYDNDDVDPSQISPEERAEEEAEEEDDLSAVRPWAKDDDGDE
ncbi:Aste57867_13121 [Aphanomyces stellatus]|uniref:Aste57867_13121 protein n=1 Tax=Aphanomyces stellatus TaxID=120398 RepID=A0A485KY03_9STRA|nr:hypothetical protein As57867_013072 [Aphanomyces stellatus]VFT89963.1 Aste57867_13121 [Aphanomyces stellatus]